MNNNVVLDYINKMNLYDYENFVAHCLENWYKNDEETSISKHHTYKNLLLKTDYINTDPCAYPYIIHSIPYELYNNPQEISVDSPYTRKLLELIFDEYKDAPRCRDGEHFLHGIFFINNLSGFSKEFYEDCLGRKYRELVQEISFKFANKYNNGWSFGEYSGVGNGELFIKNNYDGTVDGLKTYNSNNFETSISFFEERFQVRKCTFDKYITSGIGQITKLPYCSFIAEKIDEKNAILTEFEDMLNRNPSEHELELFIGKYYREIFGYNYDRIVRQIDLRFPELDISNKNRRLDVFLHNSISNDWELFELKKLITLTKSYRDIHVLTDEIYSSIQQVKNYSRILGQHTVKEKLKRDGIEYYEPSLNLIVGRASVLKHEQWRYLVTTNSDVKILTYDDLLSEMSCRLNSHMDFWGVNDF